MAPVFSFYVFKKIPFDVTIRRRKSPHKKILRSKKPPDLTNQSATGNLRTTLARVTGSRLLSYFRYRSEVNDRIFGKADFSDACQIDVSIPTKFMGVFSDQTHQKYTEPKGTFRHSMKI